MPGKKKAAKGKRGTQAQNITANHSTTPNQKNDPVVSATTTTTTARDERQQRRAARESAAASSLRPVRTSTDEATIAIPITTPRASIPDICIQPPTAAPSRSPSTDALPPEEPSTHLTPNSLTETVRRIHIQDAPRQQPTRFSARLNPSTKDPAPPTVTDTSAVTALAGPAHSTRRRSTNAEGFALGWSGDRGPIVRFDFTVPTNPHITETVSPTSTAFVSRPRKPIATRPRYTKTTRRATALVPKRRSTKKSPAQQKRKVTAKAKPQVTTRIQAQAPNKATVKTRSQGKLKATKPTAAKAKRILKSKMSGRGSRPPRQSRDNTVPADEEMSMWTKIVQDLRRCEMSQRKQKDISEQIVAMSTDIAKKGNSKISTS